MWKTAAWGIGGGLAAMGFAEAARLAPGPYFVVAGIAFAWMAWKRWQGRRP
ncbi:MAG: hypothetical protein HQL39_01910 [Alphaproteobacteria bacterium]|nr:hypothetical protein [Alphaproteobacteria bacterium]